MVVNLEKSFSIKNCPMVKKILKILYTCLKKKVYYVFLFLKVSQCKFRQKETILRKMSHGSAIFQVKDKCTSLVGSRNKLDHSEKKYGLPQ
jgi:hypothetical protein